MSKKVNVSSTDAVTSRTGLYEEMESEVIDDLFSEGEVVVQAGLSLPLIRSHTLYNFICTPKCPRSCRRPSYNIHSLSRILSNSWYPPASWRRPLQQMCLPCWREDKCRHWMRRRLGLHLLRFRFDIFWAKPKRWLHTYDFGFAWCYSLFECCFDLEGPKL